LKESFKNALELLTSDETQTFFYLGILLSFSFWLTVRFYLFLRSDKRTKGFYVSGEHGDLLIQDSAISDFIVRVLAGRVDVLVNKVFIKRKKSNYELSILVSLTPGAYVEETLSQVHNIIFEEITTRLGIKNLTHVHVTIKDFSTKERSLKRQSNKALPIIEEAEQA
jgi:hypothetical protein